MRPKLFIGIILVIGGLALVEHFQILGGISSMLGLIVIVMLAFELGKQTNESKGRPVVFQTKEYVSEEEKEFREEQRQIFEEERMDDEFEKYGRLLTDEERRKIWIKNEKKLDEEYFKLHGTNRKDDELPF